MMSNPSLGSTEKHVLSANSLTPIGTINAISELLGQDQAPCRFGSFTPCIYDTAWVSMIRHEQHSQKSWLFPRSFEYILATQQEDGTWESYASPVDGILNTLASLLSLLVHRSSDPLEANQTIDFSSRITKASNGLERLLQAWSVDETDHVGFEVLVPRLLLRVAEHNIHFEFSGHQQLLDLYQKKIKKFKPEHVYSKQPITLLHSLEALIGLVDFDRVGHHCSAELGIFGSPAATAAYLMNCSAWDHHAEAYLRTVVSRTTDGGVPSAFPTVLFETSWALSTLLSHVVTLKDLEPRVVESLSSYYHSVLHNQSGVVGFAPGILEDADDTARVQLTLQLLGAETNPTAMIAKFKSASCFRTYQLERNPSFSANCNVLLALLGSMDIEQHSGLVEKIVEYLFSVWDLGEPSDKWNLSPFYSLMLLVDALVSVLDKRNQGHLQQLPSSLSSQRIPIALCQIFSKILASQASSGSWGHSIEETAYCMIALARGLTLPWDADVRGTIVHSHQRASRFLSARPIDDPGLDYLWVEKVTYGSALLRRVYWLTAVEMTTQEQDWTAAIRQYFAASAAYSTKLWPMFSRLPLLAQSSLNSVGLALVEASRLAERLLEMRTLVFPRDELPMTKDKYLSYIPVIWTVCNQLRGQALSPHGLWEMILLSMLNYQIDEYMETVVKDLPVSELPPLLALIQERCVAGGGGSRGAATSCLCSQLGPDEECFPGSRDPSAQAKGSEHQGGIDGLRKRSYDQAFVRTPVAGVICAYIAHVLHHPSVTRLPPQDQRSLATSLRDFLIAHVVQNFDSSRRASGSPSGFSAWVRGRGADSTSCPVSFRLFTALLLSGGRRGGAAALFCGPRPRYLVQALAAHLATLCRMYNDCGSAWRDREEGSLNSLDFAEFHGDSDGNDDTRTEQDAPASNGVHRHKGDGDQAEEVERRGKMQKQKYELLDLADFERRCMESAFDELARTGQLQRTMEEIRVFVDVTDLFGQIYVVKDIASRVKRTAV